MNWSTPINDFFIPLKGFFLLFLHVISNVKLFCSTVDHLLCIRTIPVTQSERKQRDGIQVWQYVLTISHLRVKIVLNTSININMYINELSQCNKSTVKYRKLRASDTYPIAKLIVFDFPLFCFFAFHFIIEM